MKKRHIVALLAAMAAASTSAQVAAQTAGLATGPGTREATTLDISATADVRAAPDIAEIGAGVVTQATDAAAALAANSTRMNRVVAALRKAGVADRDIQTSSLSLQPQFRYEKDREPILTGFQASNQVRVTLRDLKNAGRVIDALVAEGANSIHGPQFRVEKPDPLLDKARTDAVALARARADLYARAAGMKVKRILSIREGVTSDQPMPMPRVAMAMESRADSPVEPGEVQMAVTVSMQFELE
ncbi:SIMPL domain-containing protein [Sandaracinobacteroides sp. A072]|uniref:SIMPL domain-containing protein n=1 Tax=Sandaracinobacteroides sp. A072 TaxID=3461146 RepID=UPI0040438AE5